MAMQDPHWASATTLAAEIAARRLSPVALVEALLARIARHDPDLNVFIRLDAAGALAAARLAEAQAARGELSGPLHGVPVGVKDIIDVAGLPTTAHSRLLLDNVAARDSVAVARLRAAGAIILGKLSTHEFALGGPAFDLPFPPARNPWARDHHPGGSSSGSGAGVAAGFFPLALGTDTAGSIRNPATCCGIVGLKPTYDAVPRAGVFPLAWSLDHVGPMARSVADIALSFPLLAGRPPIHLADATNLAGLRIGFVRHFHEADMIAQPVVAQGLEAAARALAGLGAKVRDIRLPSLNLFAAVNRTILNAEAWSVHAAWLRARPEFYGANTRRRLLTGAFIPAGDLVAAQRHRGQLIAAVEAAFAEVDILLCANAMDPACRIDDEAAIAHGYPRQARSPFNVTGHPALAMMSGLSEAGLPIGIQMVGRWNEEMLLLRAGAAWEQAGNWQTHHPNL